MLWGVADCPAYHPRCGVHDMIAVVILQLTIAVYDTSPQQKL